MTFYEAALRVLESAGRPLHFVEITEKSIEQNLLSHVGKTPEQTMLSRLVAMARRPRDRKVIVTAKDTFALVDWAVPEDAQALSEMGAGTPNPDEGLAPLRPPERHPEPRSENVRSVGRQDRKRWRDDEAEGRRRRKRRFPPIPEVVFEILSEGGVPLRPVDIHEQAKARELAGDELTSEQILTALLEDNQRRIDSGRRPQFVLDRETGAVGLERSGQPSEAPPIELQAAFAQALGIPLEGGRPVLSRSTQSQTDGGELYLTATAKAAVKDARREAARALRRRLGELDAGTFERSVVKVLHANGFREIKVAKRSKEGPLVTTRRKEGSLELRCAVRIVRGTQPVDRKAIQDLKRDLGHYSAQVGLLVSPGELKGDARGEALGGSPLVWVWAGDALGEKFLETRIAVLVSQVELFEIDDRFFEVARVEAEEARRRREERSRERDDRRRERGDVVPKSDGPGEPAGEGSVPPGSDLPVDLVQSEASVPQTADAEGEEHEGGLDDGIDEELEAAEEFVSGGAALAQGVSKEPARGAAPGQGRRRRRRRGRRGRGHRPRETGAGAAPEPSSAPSEPQAPLANGGGGGNGNEG